VNFEVLLLRAAEQGRTRAIDSLLQDLTELSTGLPQDPGKKKINPPRAPEPVSVTATRTSGHAVEESPPAPAKVVARENQPPPVAPTPQSSAAVSASSPEAQAAYQRLPAAVRQILDQDLHATLRGLRRN